MSIRRLLATTSLVITGLVGVLSASMIVISIVPHISELMRLNHGLELYKDLVRKPIFKLILGDDLELPWSSAILDMTLLWLSLFLAVNIFVYRNEGVTLWGHVRKNYCYRTASAWYASGLCTLVKYVFAFVATPIACLRIFLASFGSKRSLFTSCYITLDPEEFSKYLKLQGLAIAAFIAGSALVFRYLLA